MNYKLEVPLSSELEKYCDRIAATIKPYIEIKIENNDHVSWWQSKFGGLPYLPKGFEYPKSPNGDYLFLLAQINFTEVTHIEGFPAEGILQFYIPDDDLLGSSPAPNVEYIFQVLYFDKPDLNVKNIITNYDFLPETEFFPVAGFCSLHFTKKYEPISRSDYRFKKLLGQEFEDLYIKNDRIRNEYKQISSESGHKIGGYHNSVQPFDPRPEANKLESDRESYILLFQMDEDFNQAVSINWVSGICHFFIQESALKNLDFSSVIYNWECE